MFKWFRKRDEGFTLVELMVVVLIIGILVAIAIPVFNAARASAQERTCHANQRTIEGAAQTWVASEVGRNIADLNGAAGVAMLVPTFLAQAPECPTNGVGPYVLTDGATTCPDNAATAHGRFQ